MLFLALSLVAFDKVDHTYLIHKLNFYGIQGKLLSWLKDFLSDRYQSIILEGFQCSRSTTKVTQEYHVHKTLSFSPFAISLLYKWPARKHKNKIKLYVDDVLLFSTINLLNDCHQLQADLNTLDQWANRWRMVFNPSKWEYLKITSRLHSISAQYHIQKHIIKEKVLNKGARWHKW